MYIPNRCPRVGDKTQASSEGRNEPKSDPIGVSQSSLSFWHTNVEGIPRESPAVSGEDYFRDDMWAPPKFSTYAIIGREPLVWAGWSRLHLQTAQPRSWAYQRSGYVGCLQTWSGPTSRDRGTLFLKQWSTLYASLSPKQTNTRTNTVLIQKTSACLGYWKGAMWTCHLWYTAASVKWGLAHLGCNYHLFL